MIQVMAVFVLFFFKCLEEERKSYGLHLNNLTVKHKRVVLRAVAPVWLTGNHHHPSSPNTSCVFR